MPCRALNPRGINRIIRPDADSLKKALMNALAGIQIWRDGARAYGIKAEKYWTPGKPGAQIWIETEE
jgi:Holliday junction resolvase RusA-like endonuclease